MAGTASIVARDDTLLGVCFALGEDLGFNPLWPRLLFALLFFWSPATAAAAYAALGLLVALSRRLVPEPPMAETEAPDAPAVREDWQEELPLAA